MGRIMTQDFLGRFRDNPAIQGQESKFVTVLVKIPLVLSSWRESAFAHEWLTPEGQIREPKNLQPKIWARRIEIEKELQLETTLIRPVLGLGIFDNIEIGSGKDLLLTCAANGHVTISVHIPKSHLGDFKIFITEQ